MTTRDIDENVRAELNRLRESIDNIDAAVVHMLAERFKCTQQVGHLKAQHHLPPADPDRESRQIERLRQLAESAKLDPAFAEKLLNFIIAEVIRHHETIAAGPKEGPEADRNTAPKTAQDAAPDAGPKASPGA
ncbi:chorismate mutase [Streptomyces sp. NPDC005407]|uniref:chorismate mutase n=1 Tax=Streptomyces sp. NPDC005407 TaxID=3155340 RepID=UPI0033B3FE63